MDIYKIIAVALITAITYVMLKGTKPELAFGVCVCGGILILLSVIDLVSETIELIKKLGQAASISTTLIKTLIKIVGIGYLIEFSTSTVEELGCKSLADKLNFAGKIIIFTVALPILNALFQAIKSLIELI